MGQMPTRTSLRLVRVGFACRGYIIALYYLLIGLTAENGIDIFSYCISIKYNLYLRHNLCMIILTFEPWVACDDLSTAGLLHALLEQRIAILVDRKALCPGFESAVFPRHTHTHCY